MSVTTLAPLGAIELDAAHAQLASTDVQTILEIDPRQQFGGPVELEGFFDCQNVDGPNVRLRVEIQFTQDSHFQVVGNLTETVDQNSTAVHVGPFVATASVRFTLQSQIPGTGYTVPYKITVRRV
jgi:hypothetical protein